MSLMKRALFRGFSTLLEDLDRMETQITDPYWRHVSDINQLNIGEGLGEVRWLTSLIVSSWFNLTLRYVIGG